MRQSGRLIKRHNIGLAELKADRLAFREILEDMEANGGILIPTLNWLRLDPEAPTHLDSRRHFSTAFSEANFAQKFASMDKMLAAWIGDSQMKHLDADHRRRYGQILSHHDPLGLWASNVCDSAVASTLINADLGSIMDLNLLHSFTPETDNGPTLILEVGGGYGRLAEAALNVFGDSVRYVLIDSVPGSIWYSHEYLSKACPNVRFGYYYDGDEFDLDRYEAYIVPSWHFERLNTYSYDVCVNIESFQEMSQAHVDHYIGLFARLTSLGSVIYVSNARDYVFRGHFNYPADWRKLLCVNTPRSWTDVHPTEIFLRGEGNYALANEAADAFYRVSGIPRTLRRSLRTTAKLLLWKLDRDLRKRRSRL